MTTISLSLFRLDRTKTASLSRGRCILPNQIVSSITNSHRPTEQKLFRTLGDKCFLLFFFGERWLILHSHTGNLNLNTTCRVFYFRIRNVVVTKSQDFQFCPSSPAPRTRARTDDTFLFRNDTILSTEEFTVYRDNYRLTECDIKTSRDQNGTSQDAVTSGVANFFS